MRAQNLIFAIILLSASSALAQYQNIAITTNAFDQSEVTVAASPLNPNYLMAAWNNFGSVGYSKPGYAFSTNGGSSWSLAILPPHGGFSYGFDPTAAFDKFGNAFYGHIASPLEELGATYVSRTPDLGANWDIHNQVSGATSDQDKPFIAVDNTGGMNDGNIYISWTAFPFTLASSIRFSRSTDQGINFTPEIDLSTIAGDPGPNA